MKTHGIDCPCGWSAESNSLVWVEFRSWLHDVFASPSLRRDHALYERQARGRWFGDGYPCSVNGKPCPCGFDFPDCR